MDFFDFSGRNRRDPASTSAASRGVPSNGGHTTQAEGHRADPLSSQQRMATSGPDIDTWMSTQGDEGLPPLAASRGSAQQSIK
jgi:hypothetical protein